MGVQATEGEVNLFDETLEQALARIDRQALAVRQPHAVLDGNGAVPQLVSEDDWKALTADQLYVAFYNLSGQVPEPYEFEGYANKTDQERREMGLPPRVRLLGTGAPFTAQAQLRMVPMYLSRRRAGDVLTSRCTFETLGWVTHFAIGTASRGILLAGEFMTPIPMQPGNGFSFGLKLTPMTALPTDVVRQLEEGHRARLLGCGSGGVGRGVRGDSDPAMQRATETGGDIEADAGVRPRGTLPDRRE